MGTFFLSIAAVFLSLSILLLCSIKTCMCIIIIVVGAGAGDAFFPLGVTRVVRVLCNFFFIHYPVVFIVCVIFEAICMFVGVVMFQKSHVCDDASVS